MVNIQNAEILIVDDNLDNLRLLASLLKGTDYRVRPANNGKTALISIQNRLPDLILLDINMPEMNGYEVAQHLQSNDETRDIPIIFISALDDMKSIVKAFENGGVDYISKPFQFDEVNARVRTHLTLHLQRREIADLHERDKKLLEEISASEDRYRDLFDNAHDIIQSLGENGEFLYVNKHWYDLLGYSLNEMFQMTFVDIIHPDYADEYISLFHNIREKTDTVQRIETVFVSKSGREIIVQGNINCRYDSKYGFYTRGIFRDITEQRQIEKQALQLQLEHERHQILSDFIRDSSHELRTPLSSVSQQLYFIQQLTTDERILSKIAIANNRIQEIDQAIYQLHDFVRLNTQHNIQTQRISISDLIEDSVVAFTKQLQQKNIRIQTDVPDNITHIIGDFKLLKRAISELIDNAIRASFEDTSITIRVIQAENLIQLMVIDSGQGIAVECHEKVFEPLFKVNEARTSDGSGIGLGLSIVRRIIELHDGDVTVISPDNNTDGTKILLNIPNRALD